jgi:hypothetical protein
MDSATRVKPIPPGETILIKSDGIIKISNLKEQRRATKDPTIQLEREDRLAKEADLIANKFSMAQYKVLEIVTNAPIKLPDWAIHNKIKEYGKMATEKLFSHLIETHSIKIGEKDTVNPELEMKLRKMFTRKVYPLIKAPPAFNGTGFTDEKIEEIKSEALKLLKENIRPAEA